MDKYKKIILSNKAPIIQIALPGAKTATALLIFKTGSRYENKSNNGISHFLEHLFFKGTAKYPNTLALASELDSLGCEFNAFTSKEFTGYWIKAAESKLGQALEILGEMILHSKMEEAEIQREKGVIIEELNMYEENPMMHIEDVLEACIYGDTPAGWETVGTKKNIQSFTRQDFISYLETQYGANSACFILAGGVKDKDINKAKVIIGALKPNKWRAQLKNKVQQIKPRVKVSFKDIDQANLSLAVRTFPLNHAEELNVKLLSIILGGAMSSRLFINLRERNGLAYYVKTDSEFYSDSGYLTTQAGVPTEKTQQAVEIILKEYRRLISELIPLPELNRAKDLLRGRLLLQMEATDNVANWYARQAILRRQIMTPAEFMKKIATITPASLQKTAKKIFIDSGLNLAVIGRVKTSDFTKVLKF
ncbi:MAG: insulinase family protein [Candidatus Falkowbacteria bacterium]|nr:MAG: insulinase family protein [Candidatus Falkowbacteria bacterium]